jgi:hypothetical protein
MLYRRSASLGFVLNQQLCLFVCISTIPHMVPRAFWYCQSVWVFRQGVLTSLTLAMVSPARAWLRRCSLMLQLRSALLAAQWAG